MGGSIAGWSSPETHLVHCQEIASSNLAPATRLSPRRQNISPSSRPATARDVFVKKQSECLRNGGKRMGKKNLTTLDQRIDTGSITVSLRRGKELAKRLNKMEDKGKTAIKRTTSDIKNRVPGWVSKGVRQYYGVDRDAIDEAAQKPGRGKLRINVTGVAVDGISIEYRGRVLTPLHFKMRPTERPARKKYVVKATILKGQRTSLGAGTFLGRGGKKNEDGSKSQSSPVLPWQRKSDGKYPIKVVRTVSVPQMIDGRARGAVEEQINNGVEKRFNHHIHQTMK